MKRQECRGAYGDGDLSDASWTEEEGPESAEQPVSQRQVRRAPASTAQDDQLLLQQEILGDHRSHATGTAQLRGHHSQVKQGEQELLHARDSVGQIAAPRNVASIQSQRENREFETHTEALWIEMPLPVDAAWTVAYRVIVQKTRAVVAEVRVFPSEPDIPDREAGSWRGEWLGRKAHVPSGGLSTRALRSIRLGYDVRSLEQVITQVKQNPDLRPLLDPEHGWLGAMGLTQDLTTDRPRATVAGRGRPALPRSEYAALAAAYVAACASGSRRPVLDVARQRGDSVSLVRARIHTARRLGFLERGSPGCAGGTLTPAARTLLATDDTKERST
jgi:hypothetical protein